MALQEDANEAKDHLSPIEEGPSGTHVAHFCF